MTHALDIHGDQFGGDLFTSLADGGSRFGQGSLWSGEFFKGEIVVTDDPKIDLGGPSASIGDPLTLDDAGAGVSSGVDDATTALREGGLDAFSQQVISGTTEPGIWRKDLEGGVLGAPGWLKGAVVLVVVGVFLFLLAPLFRLLAAVLD